MNDHVVTLAVSDFVFIHAQQIAEVTTLSIEQVLARQLQESFNELSVLPVEEQAELSALKYLSNDALRAMAREQMPHSRQERMQKLLDLSSAGKISADEEQELVRLVEQGDKLMLRKAWAADILIDRGHKMTSNDMIDGDE